MKIKSGVSLAELQPQMAIAVLVVESVYQAMGTEAVITSGSDGQHMTGSLHYKGLALDFRISNLSVTSRAKLATSQITAALGEEFDVVLEADHLHIEFDPHITTLHLQEA